jgi:cellulose biosynthesis protein BcsQ
LTKIKKGGTVEVQGASFSGLLEAQKRYNIYREGFMKKVCFHIQKGGVGKTSLSGNVADAIARKGHKTLLVDCDPQGNSSSWLCTSEIAVDIGDVLGGTATAETAIQKLADNLYILPVIAIGGNLKKWSETELIQSPKAFEFLNIDIEKLGFDYAIYDCSPSFSQLERAIIANVDEVINPLSPEFFSVDGIEIFTHELEKIEKANRIRIKNDKIVVNLLNKSFVRHKEFYEELKKLRYTVFTIPQDSKIAESQIAHKTVFEFAPNTKSVSDFETLAAAVTTK